MAMSDVDLSPETVERLAAECADLSDGRVRYEMPHDFVDGTLAAAAAALRSLSKRATVAERMLADAEAAGARAERTRLRSAGNPRRWRCFHCDEVFVTEDEARDHFGFDCSCDPACRIKAGEERGLVKALRAAEENLARLVGDLHAENGEAMKQLRRVQAQIGEHARDAEQAGYDRALRDVEAGKVEPAHAQRIVAALSALLPEAANAV